MTTISFLPSVNAVPPFSTSVTLDGATYLLATVWNLYRPGWYVSLTDQSGNLVVFQPLIGSPVGTNIALFPGLFQTSEIVYQPSTGNFVITP